MRGAAAAWLVAAVALGASSASAREDAQAPPSPTQAPADAASQPAGVVRGCVKPSEPESLGEIVVFLEPADPAVKFATPANHASVSQKGAKFEPSLVVICVGQTVDFVNDEDRPIEHNVFSRSETKEFDLGVYKPGGCKSVTFDKPGPVKLFCSIHRYMDGAIYVCPSPFYAVAKEDGSYRIEGVASGEYHVKTWQRKQRFEEAEASVRVASGAEAVADLTLRR